MSFRSLDDADVKGKRVLVRVDLNVPMQDGKVTDVTRIEEMAPTIRELADKRRQGHPAVASAAARRVRIRRIRCGRSLPK